MYLCRIKEISLTFSSSQISEICVMFWRCSTNLFDESCRFVEHFLERKLSNRIFSGVEIFPFSTCGGGWKFLLHGNGVQMIVMMAEIRRSPVEVKVGSLSHYLQGFIHLRWLFGISEPSTVVMMLATLNRYRSSLYGPLGYAVRDKQMSKKNAFFFAYKNEQMSN